ncbi:uncharacterized protein BO97DRAFT_388725 [Aspergillus homomorphus CBS 101889]|uniref:Borealin N-terminal domain-containing protein n=1 Tax=Aspergillus homomorphus (strain CBS 101889) TaxID=1450537 RepID=A0A395HZZ3_ASPHC|nr:hypothetical protein BO97DRAFT_388725 [Aspergillus homomorphus CBS 101889]RAL13512.1 hypothetical protein BO97DRAFT_388725 [Aspergillus homomorphus CBS 101889]
MASLTSKRKSPEDASHNEEAITPTNSPPRKKLRITRNQKQALIDNLQLEITERARKLRAQYALQANDLRARIERRINRIPIALRKANMGELLEKHMRAHQEHTSPRKLLGPAKASRNFATISVSPKVHKATAASPSARRMRKQSHEGIYSDKENAPAGGESLDVLKNPKRRAKPGATAGTSRVVSQEMRGADFRILSPKTSNSRTYPQSPLRASPEKSTNAAYLSRPMSPLKPSSPLKGTSASMPGLRSARGTAPSSSVTRPSSQAATRRPASRAATTTASKTLRSPLPRPATRQVERRGSVSSSASSGTTVAKPTRTTTGGTKKSTTTGSSATTSTARKTTVARNQASAAVAAKRNAAAATTTTTKRAPTPAGGEAAAPTAGRRILRKRA